MQRKTFSIIKPEPCCKALQDERGIRNRSASLILEKPELLLPACLEDKTSGLAKIPLSFQSHLELKDGVDRMDIIIRIADQHVGISYGKVRVNRFSLVFKLSPKSGYS